MPPPTVGIIFQVTCQLITEVYIVELVELFKGAVIRYINESKSQAKTRVKVQNAAIVHI